MNMDPQLARRAGGRAKSVLQLGVSLLALLVAPSARADQSAPLPANDPPAAPAGDATPPNPASAQAAPLPASVLAMVDQKVVLRLKSGQTLEGTLVSASDGSFVIEKSDGTREQVPRIAARGIRLAEATSVGSASPASASQGAASNAPQLVMGGANAPPSDQVNSEPYFMPPRRRLFGIGTSFGGGFSAASTFNGPSQSAVSPALLLPTLELQAFLPGEYSLDLVVPVATMALSSAVLGGTVVNMDLYFNVNAGKGKTRFVFGPGIGFTYLDARGSSAASLRIPAQIGFESLSKKRGFGFKMLARPWMEVATGSSADAIGGGLLGVLVFSGYVTSDPNSDN